MKSVCTALVVTLSFSLAACATTGITVTRAQQGLVKIGMTEAEVRAALGRPGRIVHYGNQPGPSWNYDVPGTHFTSEFGIDFGADGRVVKAREYWRPTGGG
jgi:hypothetical protein